MIQYFKKHDSVFGYKPLRIFRVFLPTSVEYSSWSTSS